MNAKDFLASKGLKPKQLAKQLDCTRANVSIWISGKIMPKVDTLTRIMNALNELGANVSYDEVHKAFWNSHQERKGA
jgi:transcriptional regulator with XRE-family HTH domain